jgi:hypothetical protein
MNGYRKLVKISQSQKDKYHIFSHMWSLELGKKEQRKLKKEKGKGYELWVRTSRRWERVKRR